MRRNVPSPSRRTRFTVNVQLERDGEASTKPSLLAAVVEAARFWGGHLLVLSKTKLSHCLLSSLIGIHRETVAPIQQYPNICRSKRPFGRKEEENPHPSQKSEGLRHPKIEPTPKPGPPALSTSVSWMEHIAAHRM